MLIDMNHPPKQPPQIMLIEIKKNDVITLVYESSH